MKKCLIIINELSGSIKRMNLEEIKSVFCFNYEPEVLKLYSKKQKYSPNGFDRVVICGGDGTFSKYFNNAKDCRDPNREIIYIPFGTLNEKAKGNKSLAKLEPVLLNNLGSIADYYFSYVAATGSFTPLGYVVNDKKKKKRKVFSYISKVLKEYKVHHVDATISSISNTNIYIKDTFAIVMILKSKECFGLKFNHLYREDNETLYLLTIKAPKHKNVWGKIKLFFPLFRAFFIGFNKEYRSKYINFIPFKEQLNINLKKDEPFCVDGELVNINKENNLIENINVVNRIAIYKRKDVDKMYAEHKHIDERI
ncbi:MAG: diacylglycerol kinase family protein [Bacilli bacterium]